MALGPGDHAETVAIYRATVIGPLMHRVITYGQLAAKLRALREQRFRPPSAHSTRTYSVPTLERWLYAYRSAGLDSLLYRSSYDRLRRPTHEHVQLGSGSERLVRRYVYGEAHPQATALNLRGRPYQVYDGAGVVTSQAYDFKGNVLQASRRLRSEVHADADWSALAALTDVAAIATAAEPLLETESFGTQTAYDALNRPTSVTAPDASEVKPTYNEAGLLERVEARVRGAVTWTTFVDDIDYDAKGQRERIDYGNGTSTAYTYDPLTFRLSRLKTTRSSDSAVLQNLTYVYDPVGNIVEIGDSAQQTVFFNNAVVSPSAQYVYDAVYRLSEATGREHVGGIADVQRDQNDVPIQSLPHANDAQALRNYTEQYVYDAVGNLLRMVHQAGAGSWTRRYAHAAASNRLMSTSLPGDPVNGPYSVTYAHDAHGNMTAMPHITALTWDENDQLRSTDLGGGGVVYYDYDAAGQRVRKVWEHSGLVEERIYLGGYEVYRRRNGSGLVLERQTLHVMDGTRRVAMVETKTVDTSGPFTVTPRVRYQLDNHLGSASLEVDGAGLVIGYEEYHPYGTTAYWSARSGVEVSAKRYRYTGKERDEETGLYYHGARYYAPWLGRWTAADPAGMVDGPSLYTYARDNPTTLFDPDGRAVPQQQPIRWRWPWEPIELQKGIAAAVSKSPGGATPERSEEAPLEGGAPAALGAAAAKPLSAPPSPPARGEASGIFRIAPATRGVAPTRPPPGGGHGAGIAISVGIVLVERGVGYLVDKLSAKGDGGISAPPPGPPQPPPAPGMTPVVPPPPEPAKEQKAGPAAATPDASTEPEGSPAAVSSEQKGAAGAARGQARGSGPAAGFFEVSDAYRSSKAVQSFGAAKPVDFIFDSKSGRFIMSTDRQPHGHDSILQAARISPHSGVVGGRISRQAEGLVTDEWSGHHGRNWTPEIRQQFVDFMNKHGVRITHTPWED
ncbi:polymorphic toxin type 43 domain-containing protein [Sorangium sp. So ce1151]|uniref:polymorphic toxin type 43 domain-containing protein n=1 Tax=Sorangium sp. So ce1151 TaxID=3133332 RepID=UPI003F5F064B